jgi:hypothetical protein
MSKNSQSSVINISDLIFQTALEDTEHENLCVQIENLEDEIIRLQNRIKPITKFNDTVAYIRKMFTRDYFLTDSNKKLFLARIFDGYGEIDVYNAKQKNELNNVQKERYNRLSTKANHFLSRLNESAFPKSKPKRKRESHQRRDAPNTQVFAQNDRESKRGRNYESQASKNRRDDEENENDEENDIADSMIVDHHTESSSQSCQSLIMSDIAPIKKEYNGVIERVENDEEIDIADSSISIHHKGSSSQSSSSQSAQSTQSLIRNDTGVLNKEYDWKNDFDSTSDKGSIVNIQLAISDDEVKILSKEVCSIQLKLNSSADKKTLDILLHLLSQTLEKR